MHSGSFLEEPAAFGKETMRRENSNDKVNIGETGERGRGWMLHCGVLVSALFICVMFCGCTRREQLVLETGKAAGSAESAVETESGKNVPPQEAGQTAGAAEEGMESTEAAGGQPAGPAVEQAPPEERTICVHVCGAVKHPDVYELPAGSRVYEAVKLAGGFTEEADESYVNQAQPLSDGVKLVIPTAAEVQANGREELDGRIGVIGTPETEAGADRTDVPAGASEGRININTATQERLCEIPGIGATRAAAIVAYRQEHGGFTKIEDIMNVSGIKEGTYVKIKDSITVN